MRNNEEGQVLQKRYERALRDRADDDKIELVNKKK